MHTHHTNTPAFTASSKIMAYRSDEALILGLEDAIVLHQIRYWTDPKRCKNLKEDRLWVYNSVREWTAHLGTMSVSMIRRILKRLEDLGIIITKKFNAWRRDQRKWYTINMERLTALLKGRGKSSSPPRPSRKPTLSSDNSERLSLSATTPTPSPAIVSSAPILDVKDVSPTPAVSAEKEEENAKNGGIAHLLTVSKSTFAHCEQISSKTTHKITSLSLPSQEVTQPSVQSSLQPKSHPVREMIHIWNQQIEDSNQPLKLTPWQQRMLFKAFKDHFNAALDQWTHYCQIIAHNTFLMGGGPNQWKISLDWALRPHNIFKVLQKRYTGQKDIPQSTIPTVIDVNDLQGSDTWKRMASLLIQRLGAPTFKSWLMTCSLQDETSDHPKLSLKTPFVRDWVQQHFGDVIQTTAKDVMPQIKWFEFIV